MAPEIISFSLTSRKTCAIYDHKLKEKKEYFHQPAIASDKAASVHKGESLVHFPDISITIHSKIVYLYLTFICMYLMFECSQCTSQPTPSLLTLQQRIVKS